MDNIQISGGHNVGKEIANSIRVLAGAIVYAANVWSCSQHGIRPDDDVAEDSVKHFGKILERIE